MRNSILMKVEMLIPCRSYRPGAPEFQVLTDPGAEQLGQEASRKRNRSDSEPPPAPPAKRTASALSGSQTGSLPPPVRPRRALPQPPPKQQPGAPQRAHAAPAAMATAEVPPPSVVEPPSAARPAPGEEHIPMESVASSSEDRALTRPDLQTVDFPPSVEKLATGALADPGARGVI